MNTEYFGYVGNHGCKENTTARVTAVFRERYELVCARGECAARLKAAVYYAPGGSGEAFPTVGDFVELQYQTAGDSLILRTLPRRTYFARLDPQPGVGEQAVAANFDYVFIVQSLNNNFNPRRLERYAALAWQSGAVPVVVLTKADLAPQRASYISRAQISAPGVEVLALSAFTGEGMDQLAPFVQPGKTIVLLGSSGVGKSSLVNALLGQQRMEVKEIREDDSRGRHTTTHRQLLFLPGGAMLIDTPGMRELGMWNADEGLTDAFSDVEAFFGRCRFSDCHHIAEPGCAVQEAIARGILPAERWRSYRNLQKEMQYSADKDEYMRQKSQWHKQIALAAKNRQKQQKHK